MRQWLSCKPRISTLSAIGSHTPGRYSSTSSWPVGQVGPTAKDGSNALPSQAQADAPISRTTIDDTTLNTPAQTRHVLRALLRECTYLPDSFARQWTRQHILQRYKEYRRNPSYRPKRTARHTGWEYDVRQENKHKEARQALSTLKRANEGERGPLMSILLMAYGRKGKRRHELMAPLLSTVDQEAAPSLENPAEEDAPAHTTPSTAAAKPSRPKKPTAADVNSGNWAPYAPSLTPQLRALLQHHITTPPPPLTRNNLRRIQPKIDELNSWRRPMPLSRVKNQTKKWYANLLEKVHPPLPRAEWERLRDLGSGAASEPIVPRRKSSALDHASPATPRRLQSSHLPHAASALLETVVKYGKPDIQAAFGNRDAHRISPRFMRRLWAELFAQCPLMEWDTERDGWKVTWGQQALFGDGRTPPQRPN